MNYIKLYNTYNDYDANPNKGQQIPVVSMVKDPKQLYYPNFPKYNLLDILYSDSSGNLSVTSEVLPTTAGLTPIGLCVIPTSFIGPFYKARFVALKWMNNGSGGTSSYNMSWGVTDNLPLITLTQKFKNTTGDGFLSDYNPQNKTSNLIPTLTNSNNKLNLSVLGDINQYAATAVDGKENTEYIIKNITFTQEDWFNAQSLNTSNTNFPPFASCARYYTLGTQKRDWYLPAIGELGIMMSNLPIINNKISEIHTIYPNITFSRISDTIRSSSIKTNVSNGYIWKIGCYDGALYTRKYDAKGGVVAMIQY